MKCQYKLKYLAPKGRRTNRGFMWVTTQKNGGKYWFVDDLGKWMHIDDIKNGKHEFYGSTASCRTVRAFKRMLRKNPVLLSLNPVLAHRHYISDENENFLHSLDVVVRSA